MKKRFLLFAAFILFFFSLSGFATAAPSVVLNGQQLSFDVPPVIQDGTTLVPLRAIFEPLGAVVNWDSSTQTVNAIKGQTEIRLTLGRVDAYVDGQTITLSVPAQSIDGRTMVPLRFVSNALGADVNWDPSSEQITIFTLDCGGPPITTTLKVHYIDVGQADSIYIQLPEHSDLLIDGGNEADGQMVVDYLKAQGVDDIELLIATHPDEDHIGGLPSVLEAFSIEKIIDSGKTADTKIYKTYAADAQAEGCPWEEDNFQTLSPWGPLKFDVLTGPRDWNTTNNYSVVTRLTDGKIHFLFVGDAEIDAESAIQADINADILKVGHHVIFS